MNTWKKLSMATIAAYGAFTRTYSQPWVVADQSDHAERISRYAHLWSLYTNSVFDDNAQWAAYKKKYGLYRHTRPLYNPARRIVDFYAGMLYPGVLTVDAEKLPDGARMAIPLNEDIDDSLRAAIAQMWQWSAWQGAKSLMGRYGSSVGSVALEVVDYMDSGKVRTEVLWPGHIADLELNSVGDVKFYAVEYQDVNEETGKSYIYRREADDETFITYHDDKIVEQEENPYGFAPLVWIKHTDLGGDYGAPALRSIAKIDEICSLASGKSDHSMNQMNAPVLLSGENIQTFGDTPKTDETKDRARPQQSRARVNLMTATGDAKISTITLPPGEVAADIERLIVEVERDHPELVMYEQLRSMTTVTGPAASRMIGDTAALVEDARSNYDTQMIKAIQMAVAVAGYRANTGAWGGQLTRQQQAFAEFDLTSYERGELDFDIMPRPVIPLTQAEQIEIDRMQQSNENDRSSFEQRQSFDRGIQARLNES